MKSAIIINIKELLKSSRFLNIGGQ